MTADARSIHKPCLGQIEGGIVMGIGTALTEEYIVEDGVPKTLRWRDYKTPHIGQVPELDIHIVEHPVSTGTLRRQGYRRTPVHPHSSSYLQRHLQCDRRSCKQVARQAGGTDRNVVGRNSRAEMQKRRVLKS